MLPESPREPLQTDVLRLPGLLEYARGFALQHAIQDEQLAGKRGPIMLLVEHEPTITIGRRGNSTDVVAPEVVLRARGVAVHETDRGGQVTYHGPGQIVAYPMLPLERIGIGLHEYMRGLEEAVIRTLARWNLEGYRWKGNTGVFVGKDKICAMGIRARRWWTMHGLALNVRTNLNHFGLIVPCGIRDRGVTSMDTLLGDRCPAMPEVEDALVEELASVFPLAMNRITVLEAQLPDPATHVPT